MDLWLLFVFDDYGVGIVGRRIQCPLRLLLHRLLLQIKEVRFLLRICVECCYCRAWIHSTSPA